MRDYNFENKVKKLAISFVSLVLFIVLIMANLQGCTKGCQKKFKHIKSGAIGLNRIVTLYDYNGEKIKQWQGRLQVEKEGDGTVLSFICDGKEIKIASGIVVIEEI